jgi:hypothetical protein
MKTLKKSDRGRRAPLIEVAKLKTLARTIRDGHEATEQFIKSSKDNARDALREAILTGKALMEVKKIVGFGGFERWMKEHCRGISQSTRRRYVSLYNAFGQDKSHMTNLPEMNLRKAYLQLGIINEPTAVERPDDGALNALVQTSPPSRKLLTNGATLETQSTNNESTERSENKLSVESIDAEIVDRPRVTSGPALVDSESKAQLAKLESSVNALLLDLINIYKSGKFPLEELRAIAFAPMANFFTEANARQTPKKIKESFFKAPANAGLLSLRGF